MRLLLFLLISMPVFADWHVVKDSPVCLTYEALKIASKNELGFGLNPYEQIKLANDCSLNNEQVNGIIQSVGVYSKIKLLSYDGKMKIYFVNTRDLESH